MRSRASLAASAAMLLAGGLCYPFRAGLPVQLRGGLADFLWSGAFACALMAITGSRRWAAFGFVVAEVLELSQLIPSVPGTFDTEDLVAIALGWGVGLIVDFVLSRSLRRQGAPDQQVDDQRHSWREDHTWEV